MGTKHTNPENTTFNDQADGKFDENVEAHQYDVEHHISTKQKDQDESEYEHDSDQAESGDKHADGKALH